MSNKTSSRARSFESPLLSTVPAEEPKGIRSLLNPSPVDLLFDLPFDERLNSIPVGAHKRSHEYTYRNRKTRQDRNEIRLNRLYPAVAMNSPLVCDVRVVSLDDQPEYSALSYCWGTAIFNHEVIFQGETFLITEKLDAALRQMRLLEPDKRPLFQPLWVDNSASTREMIMTGQSKLS
jgi:hypothetical protein